MGKNGWRTKRGKGGAEASSSLPVPPTAPPAPPSLENAKEVIDVRLEIARRAQLATEETENGNEAFDRNDMESALLHFDAALKVVPRHVGALGNRANVKITMGDFEGCIVDTSMLIKLSQNRGIKTVEEKFNLAVVRYTQAEAYFHLKSFYKSLGDCDNALELWPSFGEALCLRGATHNALGSFKVALKDLNSSIDLKPSYAMAYRHRGICLCCLKKFAASTKDLEQALMLDANDEAAKAWFEKARNELRVEEQGKIVRVTKRQAGKACLACI